LVGVTNGKFDEGGVELVASAKITGNAGGVTGARLSAGQGPATNADIFEPIGLAHLGQIKLHFHIAELPEIEMVPLIIMSPAEKNIAGRLEHTLARDHAFAVIVIAAFAGVSLQDRGKRLLELKEQWRIVVAKKQGDRAARADTAHAHDLAGDVDDPVMIQQDAAFLG
jgi:hypothetical protein